MSAVIAFIYLAVVMQAKATISGPYMSMKGNFSVDGKGAVNYSIPIETIPSKVSPKITLSYNSQSGTGYVGNGWSLSGSPNIRICSLNKRQDNKWSNIMLNMGPDDYSVNRFCMGGSRLSVIKGDYGQDKSIYQSELMGKYEITSVGKCGDGPCSFEVKGSDGTISIYGGTPNTTVQLEDKDILVWGMTTKTDRYGNSIKYTYVDSDMTNVLYPKQIDYFFDKEDSRKVVFTYQPTTRTNRQQKRIGLGGYSFKPDKVISSISTHDLGDVGVLNYNFTYKYDRFSNTYSLIKLDKTSFDNTQSYFSHKFGYKDYTPNNPEFSPVNTISIPVTYGDWDGVKVVIMDKYGDGYKGIGIISNTNNKAIFSFARGDKDGKLTIAEDAMDLGRYSPTDKSTDSYTFMSFDKNGDGLNDLIKIFKGSDGQAYVQSYLSSAGKPNFEVDPIVQSLDTQYIDSGKLRISYTGRDINGDGLSDIVSMSPSSDQPTATYNITVYYASVKGGFPTHEVINGQIENSVIPTVDQSINFADYDKDTLSDFFLLKKEGGITLATPLYNRQGKFLAPNGQTSKDIKLGPVGDWSDLPAYKFLDFNNDGLSDLVKFNFKSTQPVTGNIYMNTGNMFGDMLSGSGSGENTTHQFTLTDLGEDPKNAHNVTFVDINGDHQPDIMKYRGGNDDPKVPDETYFDIFLHTGNTFVKGRSTTPFGAHTRNIVSSMGDNPLGSIVSVKQISNEAQITVYMNNISPPERELITIDNGNGLVYDITYEKVSPFLDYANIKQPDYPNILLSKVRMVASSYSKSQDKGKGHGYSTKHDFEYKFPIYNRHDWMFAGYSSVSESIKSLDKFIDYGYSTVYPTRGKLVSKTIGQLSSGTPFSNVASTYSFDIKYPSVDPKVVIVYKDSVITTTYEDSTASNASSAYVKTVSFGIDKTFGIPAWTSTSYGGKNTLYKCYRYSINDTGKGTYTVGDRTGTLFTKSESQCNTFMGNKNYDIPFVRTSDDFDTLFIKYSDDGLFTPIQSLKYSSVNKAYGTTTSTVNKKGQVIKSVTSSDFTPLTGVYPNADNLLTTIFTFDEGGYVNSSTANKLVTLSKTDSRFGKSTSNTTPSGSVTTHSVDLLGTSISTEKNGNSISKTTFSSDKDGLFKQQDIFIGKNKSTIKKYLGADSKAWKHTVSTNNDSVLTTGEIALNHDTGQVISKFSPYFDKSKAKVVAISYDKRWLKSKEVRDDRVNKFVHEYSSSEATVSHMGNDPTHKLKTLVLLGSKTHNFVNKTKSTSTPFKTTAVGTFDVLGNLISDIDYRGLVSTKTYDTNRKMTQNITPDSGTENYFWNASGQVVKHTRGDIVDNYTYDSNNRIIKRTRTEGKLSDVVTYEWDKDVKGFFNKGKLTSITNGKNVTSMNYDIDGSLVDKSWSLNGLKSNFSYTYYAGGYPLSVVYPDKSTVSYLYNSVAELSGFKYKDSSGKVNPSDSVMFSNYGINGNPSLISFGDGMSMTKVTDGWGRSGTDTVRNGKTVVSTMKYTWDNTGNITSQTRNGDVTSYTYDALQRLIEAKNARRDLSYKYDENNNLLQNGSNTFTMDTKTNRLANGVISGKPVKFEYDAAGRLLGDSQETYGYGASGRLEVIKSKDGITNISYFNQKKLSDGVITYLDNGFEIKGATNNKRIKAFGQTWLVINSDKTSSYIIPDRLSSQLMSIDSKSMLPTSKFEYEPYGTSHEIK